MVPIEFLRPAALQPRRYFGEDELAALTESIRAKGVMQPLLVRRLPDDDDHYEIVAGERRWRAAQLAGCHELPVVVYALSDREALEVALLENVQRQDLTPLEEADGYRRFDRRVRPHAGGAGANPRQEPQPHRQSDPLTGSARVGSDHARTGRAFRRSRPSPAGRAGSGAAGPSGRRPRNSTCGRPKRWYVTSGRVSSPAPPAREIANTVSPRA